jgi:uncharacterized protein (DUF2461 family)
MALAISKYMEIKTKTSLKRVITTLKRVTDAILVDKITAKQTIMRMNMNEEVRDILKGLGLPY